MYRFSEEQVRELSQLLEGIRDFSNFRRLQAVWFRAAKNMTAPEIEELIGLTAQSIRQIQAEYFREGISTFRKSTRGGRRHQNLCLGEEKELLKPFFEKAQDSGVVAVSMIKNAYEKKLGRRVHKTTIYRMLKRHGWRKLVPRPSHPKSDINAQEAFKKTSR
jgi:transposase